MLRIALALALLASSEASAHCYSVWRYPWPQRCGFSPTIAKQERRRAAARLTILHSVAATSVPNQEHAGNETRLGHEAPFVSEAKPPSPDPDIPLPSLARTDCDGGAADEPTRVRILLRAALEAANGH